MDVVNLKAKLAQLTECWSPRVVGEVNESYVKLARLKGQLAWHTHDEEDEMFLVLEGRLKIEMKDESVYLGEGECFVVPKRTPHNPIAEEECSVLLIEPKSTKHTGNVVTPQTRSIEEQLKDM